jgi:hypothetical protein
MDTSAARFVDIPGLLLATDWIRVTGIAAYSAAALTAALAGLAATRDRSENPGPRFWLPVAALFTLLAVDVATSFRFEVAKPVRAWLRQTGGPVDRSFVQAASFAFLGALILGAIALLWLRRRGPGRLALLGASLAVAVWVAEAISDHELSKVVYRAYGPLPLCAWLWILAALLVLVQAAGSAFRRSRRAASGPSAGG